MPRKRTQFGGRLSGNTSNPYAKLTASDPNAGKTSPANKGKKKDKKDTLDASAQREKGAKKKPPLKPEDALSVLTHALPGHQTSKGLDTEQERVSRRDTSLKPADTPTVQPNPLAVSHTPHASPKSVKGSTKPRIDGEHAKDATVGAQSSKKSVVATTGGIGRHKPGSPVTAQLSPDPTLDKPGISKGATTPKGGKDSSTPTHKGDTPNLMAQGPKQTLGLGVTTQVDDADTVKTKPDAAKPEAAVVTPVPVVDTKAAAKEKALTKLKTAMGTVLTQMKANKRNKINYDAKCKLLETIKQSLENKQLTPQDALLAFALVCSQYRGSKYDCFGWFHKGFGQTRGADNFYTALSDKTTSTDTTIQLLMDNSKITTIEAFKLHVLTKALGRDGVGARFSQTKTLEDLGFKTKKMAAPSPHTVKPISPASDSLQM